MKKSLSLLIIAATLIASCKKDNKTTPKPSTPVVLLTKVTNVTPNDPGYGTILVQFSYNGKRLTKASFYGNGTTFGQIHTFNYDSNGNVTGSTIVGPGNYFSSAITATGPQINKILFTASDNSTATHILTYQNNLLVNWHNTTFGDIAYTYDSKGNNIKQVDTGYTNGTPDGNINTDNYQTFDNNKNFINTIPYWIYFEAAVGEAGLGLTPGINNPLTDAGSDNTNDSYKIVYSYEYNSDGYPTKMTIAGPNPQVYTYEYTIVN